MNKKIILLVTMLFAGLGFCKAQGGFMPGYIISNSNDTIYGMVKDRDVFPYIRFSKIKFKPATGAPKLVLSPSQIKAYKKGDDYFESLSCFMDTTVFVKVIHKGFLSLYKYEFFGESESTLLLKKENSPCVTEVNGIEIKNQLLNYFEDCSPARERLKGIELNRDQLADIVDIYNKNHTETK